MKFYLHQRAVCLNNRCKQLGGVWAWAMFMVLVLFSPLYGELLYKSEERSGVRVVLRALAEHPLRMRVTLVRTADLQDTVGTLLYDAAGVQLDERRFKTRVFYDELHVIRKILVTEERINGVWGELNSETRLVATLDAAGVPQTLVERINNVGSRELFFDDLGRVVSKQFFFAAPGAAGGTRVVREDYVYAANDIITNERYFRGTQLKHQVTRSLPVASTSGHGLSWREQLRDAAGRLLRTTELLRTQPTPQRTRERHKVYDSSARLLRTFTRDFLHARLVSEREMGVQEVTYRYDEQGRLILQKREQLPARRFAQYSQYTYANLSEIATPVFLQAFTRYSIMDFKLYDHGDVLAEYRLLRLHGIVPNRLVTWTQRTAERLRYPTTVAHTRMERHFLPTQLLTLLFENNILREKRVNTLSGIPLGVYRYHYDEAGRLYESVFSGLGSRAMLPQTVRYLYRSKKAVEAAVTGKTPFTAAIMKNGLSGSVDNWHYFGHSLFSYLAKRQVRLEQLTAADFVKAFAAFRLRETRTAAMAAAPSPLGNVLTQFIYMAQADLARILFIDEQGKVRHYLKFQQQTLGEGRAQLTLRYYAGEPAFQYGAARKLPTAVSGISTLSGERHAFLYDGGIAINERYAERRLASFQFEYNADALTAAARQVSAVAAGVGIVPVSAALPARAVQTLPQPQGRAAEPAHDAPVRTEYLADKKHSKEELYLQSFVARMFPFIQ